MMKTDGRSNLTAGQFRIWAGQKLDPQCPLYNMALAFRIRGELDVEVFASAFNALVNGSDALRTVIFEESGVPRQKALARIDRSLSVEDLTRHPEPLETAHSRMKAWAGETFDMAAGMFRSVLLKLDKDDHIWFLNQHHLITDGWSCAVLYQKMSEFYQLSVDHRLDQAPQLPQYKDYRIYERDFRQTDQYAAAAAYWEKTGADAPASTELYGMVPSPTGTGSRRFRRDIGTSRSEALRALANEDGFKTLSMDLSLFNIFSALLYAFLFRVSGNTDLVIGTPSHHRPTAAFKQTVGLFIELFPLRISMSPDMTFRSLVTSFVPTSFDFLKYALPGTGGTQSSGQYAVVLNYINSSYPEFSGMPMQSKWIHPDHVDRGHAMRLQVQDFDRSGNVQVHFDLSSEMFDDQRAQKTIRHFFTLLDAFLQDPDRRIADVDLLSDREKSALAEVNRTQVPIPDTATVLSLLGRQVEMKSQAKAIEDHGESTSFADLDKQSNQVAVRLRAAGVAHGAKVAVFMERSTELVTALIGILKTGAAFVPMDAAFPAKRIAYVIKDCGASAVLTQPGLVQRLPDSGVQTICIDPSWRDTASDGPMPWDEPVRPDDLAYVIYTSGSTGRPKGVMITHGALANYLLWAGKQYMHDGPHAFAFFSTIAADLTLTSIFLPLISGGVIRVYREAGVGVDLSVMDVFREDAVDIIKLTPSHLTMLASQPIVARRLKKLIVGGEDFKTALAKRVYGLFDGNVEIFNEYGPTEATVGCMIHRFDPAGDDGASVAIGRPIDNMGIHVLDIAMNPVPLGVKGEIYIAGDGLARGYLNQPALTSAAFIPSPFKAGENLYKSGDMGRWKTDGVLEFLGRGDQQVKVRGFRIELGEIAAALMDIPGIQDSFVRVVDHHAGTSAEEVRHCRRCGLSSNHPKAKLDGQQICRVCRTYEGLEDVAHTYFKKEEDLSRILNHAQSTRIGPYDCLMQYSGGKDSTYALYQLVERGMHPLVFSFDNGFISDGAKENIRRVVDDLNLDLVWGTTPAMNEIFVDSLRRFSNVCNGCQKVINTQSVNLAREKGIRYIFTGLSRGQFFETRVSELFSNQVFDSAAIDRNIIEARKAYHRMKDAVSEHLDVSAFEDDTLFDEIQFVDFYRYTNVELDEMLGFLDKQAPWIRPTDTGRSTNCMINEAGIYIHKKERGFHNYELPYSWDVRLGHKDRDSALEELDDDIDIQRVNKLLRTIGYNPEEKMFTATDHRIVAYYLSDRAYSGEEMRASLAESLPAYMIPSHFVRLTVFPLNATGKVDEHALPRPDKDRGGLSEEYAPPRNAVEEMLAVIWARVMGGDSVGIHDNFFDLGGDSILGIQIVAQAAKYGLDLTPAMLFQFPTVADLAATLQGAKVPGADQDAVTGPVPLTPAQHEFFELGTPNPNHWCTMLQLRVPEGADVGLLDQVFQHLLNHHDALRLTFRKKGVVWTQEMHEGFPGFTIGRSDVSNISGPDLDKALAEQTSQLAASLSLTAGPLILAHLFTCADGQPDRLVTATHPLVADALSWNILLEDMVSAYGDLERKRKPILPRKTASFKYWSEQLVRLAQSETTGAHRDFWINQCTSSSVRVPRDTNGPGNGLEATTHTFVSDLNEAASRALIDMAAASDDTGIDTLVLTALVQTLCEWSGASEMRLMMLGNGRDEMAPDVSVSRTVGWFSAHYPLLLKNPMESEAVEIIGAVNRQLNRVPGKGLSFGALRYLSDDEPTRKAFEINPGPELLFSYKGDLDRTGKGYTLFQPEAPARMVRDPKAERPFLIEIHAMIDRRQLQTHWTFSTARHSEKTIQNLAARLNIALKKLSSGTASTQGDEAKASDFPLADLDDAQLAKIAKLLD